jgi:hypothetical protein
LPLAKQREQRQRKEIDHFDPVGTLPRPLSHPPHPSLATRSSNPRTAHPLLPSKNPYWSLSLSALFLADSNRRRAYDGAWFSARGLTADRTQSVSSLAHAHRMLLRARLFLPRSWCLSQPRSPSQNRSPALWGPCEGLARSRWCWGLVMHAYHRAYGAPAICGCPVCPTGPGHPLVSAAVRTRPGCTETGSTGR